jgi:hypothetical protein
MADYLVAPDIQLRFTTDCDLVFTSNDQAIKNNIMASVFLRKGQCLLMYQIGSELEFAIFDPNDVDTRELIADSIVDSVAIGEPRVMLDPNILFITDNSGYVINASLNFMVLNKNTGWKSIKLSPGKIS